MRKKLFIIGFMLLPAVGCSSMNNTEKGLVGGGAVGAGIGALATRGNPAGALVGGALGAIVGGAAGSNQDRREDHRAAVTAVANAQARNQMKLHEIIQMTQSNVGDETIIRQMDATGSCFQFECGGYHRTAPARREQPRHQRDASAPRAAAGGDPSARRHRTASALL